MKTKLVLWLVVAGMAITTPHGVAAAPHNEDWNHGKLELSSGVVMDGDINYNWKAEVVQLRLDNGTIKAYSASQVAQFMYYDDLHNALRTFASVDFMIKPTVERKIFLEQCATGPLTVYRRLRHQHEPIRVNNPASYGSDQQLYSDLESFVYYVYDEDTMMELDHFALEIWPRMAKEFGSELNHYRSSRSLDTGTTLGRLVLITQYNALKSVSQASSVPSEVMAGTDE